MNPEAIPYATELKSKEPQKIWFDVTDIAEFIKKDLSVTGIQRMVSMLVLAFDSPMGQPQMNLNQLQGKDGISEVRKPSRGIGEFVLCRYDFNIHSYVAIPRAPFQQMLKDFMAGKFRGTLGEKPSKLPQLENISTATRSLFASFVANSSFRPLIPSIATLLASRALNYFA